MHFLLLERLMERKRERKKKECEEIKHLFKKREQLTKGYFLVRKKSIYGIQVFTLTLNALRFITQI